MGLLYFFPPPKPTISTAWLIWSALQLPFEGRPGKFPMLPFGPGPGLYPANPPAAMETPTGPYCSNLTMSNSLPPFLRHLTLFIRTAKLSRFL